MLEASRGVRGALGAGRECRDSGTRRGLGGIGALGASRDVGDNRQALGANRG